MLFPKKVKHRKWQTARKHPLKRGMATRGSKVDFGSFGLKATSGDRITSNQIEASRRVISRTIGKFGKIWIRIFPDRPFTRKGAEVGMGKGKGAPTGFVSVVEPGRVLFEVDGVSEAKAKEALIKAGKKLPVSIKVVSRS
jgi:large subunit ribosomal protein L16